MMLEVALQLAQGVKTHAPRWLLITAHHEQALPTRQLANAEMVGTMAVSKRCVSQQFIKGDSETALAPLWG